MSGIFSIIAGNRPARFAAALLAFLALTREARADEIAVIPYRVETVSEDFTSAMGAEYARLIGVAAAISRHGVEVTPPRDVAHDLESMKLSPQDVITKEDLDLLGRTRRVDRFLLGSLAKIKGRYRSQSVLYSVRERRVVARADAEADTLFSLAEREVREAFAGYRLKALGRGEEGRAVDICFLIDASYRASREWAELSDAVADTAAAFIDARRADTRVYIVPFSSRVDLDAVAVSENSITTVREALARLRPAGAADDENFVRALRYAVKNLRWRASAAKIIACVSNSPLKPKGAEQLAVMCKGKGIVIHAVSLGGISGDDAEFFDRCSRITGGTHRHAAYRQRIYNAEGDFVNLYYENGRIFISRSADASWRAGLYERGESGRPRRFLEELFVKERASPEPYRMGEYYERSSGERAVRSEALETNIGTLIGLLAGQTREKADYTASGKVLLTDGVISFWTLAPDEGFMEFFERMKNANRFFPLCVSVKKNVSSPYGIELVPVAKDFSADYIPSIMKAPLDDIVKRSDYYRTNGLFVPPVWFVNVKVGEAARGRRGTDVRDR